MKFLPARLWKMPTAAYHEYPPQVWGIRTNSILYVPNVSVIATIPYRSRALSQLPPGYATSPHATCAYPIPRGLRYNPLSILFESGDRRFPSVHKNAFRRQANDGYRGAMWFRSIKLHLSEGGNLCGLEGILGTSLGSTPLRPSMFIAGAPRTPFSSLRGESEDLVTVVKFEVQEAGNSFILDCRHEFRLSSLADLVQVAMTGRAAPWVWMDLKLSFLVQANTSEAILTYKGSSMPSHSVFIGTQPVIAYDMTTLNQTEVDGFFQVNPHMPNFALSFVREREASRQAPGQPHPTLKHFLPVSRRL